MRTVKTSATISAREAFTLVELLTVMVVIAILAGLVLGTAGYIPKKGASSRAEAEIAAMSAALENYKADTGTYPDPASTINPSTSNTPPSYRDASRALYQALSGDGGDALKGGSGASDGVRDNDKKQYMEFKSSMLGGLDAKKAVTSSVYVQDPFGNSYGYSISGVYNPTFDLWSTGGGTKKTSESNDEFRKRWITNW